PGGARHRRARNPARRDPHRHDRPGARPIRGADRRRPVADPALGRARRYRPRGRGARHRRVRLLDRRRLSFRRRHAYGPAMTLQIDRVPSPIGTIIIVSDGDALNALLFEDHEDWLTRHLAQHYPGEALVPTRDPAGAATRLAAYFDGDLTAIDDIAVRLAGSDFQRAVWAALREIPVGTTTTYGALARRLGKPPGASRAVGLANGANPVSIV